MPKASIQSLTSLELLILKLYVRVDTYIINLVIFGIYVLVLSGYQSMYFGIPGLKRSITDVLSNSIVIAIGDIGQI